MTNTYTWHTAAIVRETADAVTVIFNTNGIHFSYLPGQFINVTLTINGTPVTRSYSLSSLPGADSNPAITLKRVPGGIMSNYIADNSHAVKSWKISGPHGAFILPDHTHKAEHLVLLAGGSGITPLFAIGRAFINRFPEASVTLIYSSRSEEDIIFRNAIDKWAGASNGRVTVYHALSAANRRINKLVARKLIKTAVEDPLSDARYFICGPAELMMLHKEMLEAMQVPDEKISLEWFAPAETAADIILPETQQEVLLHFYEQTNLLEVAAGKTILSAALEDKIPLPYSCRAGTCGICTARLTSGKVTMRSNFSLRKSDLEEGLILLCQSYPLTADVTVEID